MPRSHLVFIPAVFLLGALAGLAVAAGRSRRDTARTARGNPRRSTLLAALALFAVTLVATHMAPLPGGVQALRASVNQQALFDQRPAFSASELYGRMEQFGDAGRVAYRQFTYTTDVVFPLALFLFLFTLARFVVTRVTTPRRRRCLVGAVPLLWLVADLLENGIIFSLLRSYPEQHLAMAQALAVVTVAKFSLLLASLVLPLVLYVMSLRPKMPVEVSA